MTAKVSRVPAILPAMIIIECSWCDGQVALASLDATSVECHECLVSVEIAPDPEVLAAAA